MWPIAYLRGVLVIWDGMYWSVGTGCIGHLGRDVLVSWDGVYWSFGTGCIGQFRMGCIGHLGHNKVSLIEGYHYVRDGHEEAP